MRDKHCGPASCEVEAEKGIIMAVEAMTGPIAEASECGF